MQGRPRRDLFRSPAGQRRSQRDLLGRLVVLTGSCSTASTSYSLRGNHFTDSGVLWARISRRWSCAARWLEQLILGRGSKHCLQSLSLLFTGLHVALQVLQHLHAAALRSATDELWLRL